MERTVERIIQRAGERPVERPVDPTVEHASTTRPRPTGWHVVGTLVLMFILGLVMALGITPRLSGGSHVVVTSEAMAPSISSGDVALAHPVAPAYLAVGDVVAHYQGEDQVVRRLTHMYFDDADQVIALVTSADAVPGSEYRFDTEELIGRVVNYIPRTVSQFAVPVFAATSGVLVVLVATMLRRRGAAAR